MRSLVDRILGRRRPPGHREEEVAAAEAAAEETVRRAYRALPPDRAERLRQALDDTRYSLERVRR